MLGARSLLTPLAAEFAAPVADEQSERLPSAARLHLMGSEVGFLKFRLSPDFFKIYSSIFGK